MELSMKRNIIGFESTPEVDEAIEAERQRLAEGLPGSKVTKSVAMRSLLIKASTVKADVDA